MDNGKKNTPKVLTTNDIREDARNWTLAGDVGLLAHLEQFSENVINKTQETQKLFSDLVEDYEQLYTKFGNVTNQFLALQNCQFVENRVYDEETPTEEKAVVKVQDEVEQEKLLLMQYKEAVEVGIKLLDTHFQEVQLPPNSDSEEDDDEISAGNSIVWKPKNPYAGKKFPLLIGSAEWWADDHVGLITENEDILDTEKIISESESDMESLKSADKEMKTSSSSSIENIKPISTKPLFPDSSSEDLFGLENNENLKSSVSDDLFFKRSASQEPENFLPDFEKGIESQKNDSFEDVRPPETEHPEDQPPTAHPKKVDSAFTRELMAKLNSVSNKKENKEEKKSSEERLPTVIAKPEENLFDETDDSSDLFTAKGGTRQAAEAVKVAERSAGSVGQKSLFLEDEVDDELFKGEKNLFSGSNLFESDGLKTEAPEDLPNVFDSSKEPKKPPKTESTPPKKPSVNNLFNDLEDDDDDDSLFATKPADKSLATKENVPPKKTKSLVDSDFGWDDDGLFESSAKTEDDLFGSSKLFESEKVETKAPTESGKKTFSPNLFPEDPPTESEIGDFRKTSKTEEEKKESFDSTSGARKPFAKEVSEDPFGLSPGKEQSGKKISILDREDDDEDDLFSKSLKEEKKPSLKVTAFLDDEDTALFTEKPKPPDSVSVSSSRSSLFDDVSGSKSRLASVFEKDKKPEEDLFSVAEDSLFGGEGKEGKELFPGKRKEKSSLFDDCDDGDDLFGGDLVKRTESVVEEGKKRGKGGKALMDDLGDEDLFKASGKLRETKSDILRPPEQKLFVDDLDDADLFSSKASATKPKPPSSLSLKASESESRGRAVGKLNIPDNLKMRFESVAKNIGSGGGRPVAEEPKEEEEKKGDVLDEPPVSSNLLKCPSRDRVKIPGRRRPQSRRARQEAIRNSGVWDQPTSPRASLDALHPSKHSLPSPVPSNPLSPSTDEEDSFKVPELDTNFEKEDQTIFKSDLFESSRSSKPEESLLFDGAPVLSPLSPRKAEEAVKTEKPKPASIFDDEDLNGDEEDDLFGTPKLGSAGGQLAGKTSLFEQDSDDEDELFGGSKVVSGGKEKEKEKKKEEKEEGKGKGGGEGEEGKHSSGFVDPLGLMSKD